MANSKRASTTDSTPPSDPAEVTPNAVTTLSEALRVARSASMAFNDRLFEDVRSATLRQNELVANWVDNLFDAMSAFSKGAGQMGAVDGMSNGTLEQMHSLARTMLRMNSDLLVLALEKTATALQECRLHAMNEVRDRPPGGGASGGGSRTA